MNALSGPQLSELIDGLAGLPYGGEAVDQRTHALQAAWLAADAGADDELVLAAALHDIGRARSVKHRYPGLPHEPAGAAFARSHIGEQVAWIIAQHVPAKRYLVATDPAYHGLLSPVSVASLKRQGGPMSEDEAAEFGAHPMAADAVALRRWDDAAKDQDGPVLAMADLLAAHERCAARRPGPGSEGRAAREPRRLSAAARTPREGGGVRRARRAPPPAAVCCAEPPR